MFYFTVYTSCVSCFSVHIYRGDTFPAYKIPCAKFRQGVSLLLNFSGAKSQVILGNHIEVTFVLILIRYLPQRTYHKGKKQFETFLRVISGPGWMFQVGSVIQSAMKLRDKQITKRYQRNARIKKCLNIFLMRRVSLFL